MNPLRTGPAPDSECWERLLAQILQARSVKSRISDPQSMIVTKQMKAGVPFEVANFRAIGANFVATPRSSGSEDSQLSKWAMAGQIDMHAFAELEHRRDSSTPKRGCICINQ